MARSVCGLTGSGGILPILVIMSGLFSGCDREEDFIPPDHTDPNQPLVSKTIGSGGGSMETDSLILVIPKGAFQSDCRLEVYAAEADQPVKNTAVTGQYTIKGLPAGFADSILIKLKYRGLLVDGSFICHGATYRDEERDSTVITYDLSPCTDSSGYLAGYYKRPPDESGDEGGSSKKAGFQPEPELGEILDFFLGLTSYRTYETPAFGVKIEYPTTLDPGMIQKFSLYLEDIYRLFRNTGLNDDQMKGFVFPEVIRFLDNRNGLKAGCLYEMEGSWHVDYDTKDDEKMSGLRKSTIFGILHRFFRNLMKDPFLNYRYPYWFDYGVITWYDRQHLDRVEVLDDDIRLVFKGLHGTYDDRPYLAGPEVVEYLVGRYGNLFISNVYHRICEANFTMDAVCAAADAPAGQWLADFYENFLEGKVHSVSGERFNDLVFTDENITAKMDLPEANTPTILKADYRELSAHIYYFHTDDNRIDEQTFLQLKFAGGDESTDHFQILAFAFHRETHEIIFIKKDRELTIGMLENLKYHGYDLLALVVNGYYSHGLYEQSGKRTSIWLSVELKQVEALDIPVCTMTLGSVDVRYRNDEGATWMVKNQAFSFTNGYKKDGAIEYLDDTTYAAYWDYFEGESRYWGEVRIIIHPETLLMESIDFTQNERYIDRDKGSDWKIESHLQCGSVLLDPDLRFRAVQPDISDYIVSFAYRRENYSADKTIISEVDEIFPTEDSYLEIQF